MDPPKKGVAVPADIQTTNGVVKVANPHEEYYKIMPMLSAMLRCEACLSTESNLLIDGFTAPCQHTVCGKCKKDLMSDGVFYCPHQCPIGGMREDGSLLQQLATFVHDRMPFAHVPCAVFDQKQMALNKEFEAMREKVFGFVKRSCDSKFRSQIVTVRVPVSEYDVSVIRLFLFEMAKLRGSQMQNPDKRAVLTQPQAYAEYSHEVSKLSNGPKFIVVNMSTVHELMGFNETISAAVSGNGTSDVGSDGASVRSNSSTRTVGLGMLSHERKKSVLMSKSTGSEVVEPHPEQQATKRRAVSAKSANGTWSTHEPVFSAITLAEVDGASKEGIK